MPGVHDNVEPEPPIDVVHEAFNVEEDVDFEECTSNRTLTVLPSGSVAVVDNFGVLSAPNRAALEAPGA